MRAVSDTVLLNSIAPAGFFCSPCKTAVNGLGSALIGMGCTAGVTAFEVACNAALDLESFGLGAAACAAAGVALGVACNAGGGAITQTMVDSVAGAACSWAC